MASSKEEADTDTDTDCEEVDVDNTDTSSTDQDMDDDEFYEKWKLKTNTNKEMDDKEVYNLDKLLPPKIQEMDDKEMDDKEYNKLKQEFGNNIQNSPNLLNALPQPHTCDGSVCSLSANLSNATNGGIFQRQVIYNNDNKENEIQLDANNNNNDIKQNEFQLNTNETNEDDNKQNIQILNLGDLDPWHAQYIINNWEEEMNQKQYKMCGPWEYAERTESDKEDSEYLEGPQTPPTILERLTRKYEENTLGIKR